MIETKGENPSPREESQDRIIFRILVKIKVRGLALINHSSCQKMITTILPITYSLYPLFSFGYRFRILASITFKLTGISSVTDIGISKLEITESDAASY